jgi:hypothetical protein
MASLQQKCLSPCQSASRCSQNLRRLRHGGSPRNGPRFDDLVHFKTGSLTKTRVSAFSISAGTILGTTNAANPFITDPRQQRKRLCAGTLLTGKETRVVLRGHLQRGGPPTHLRSFSIRGLARLQRAWCGKAFGRMTALMPADVGSCRVAISANWRVRLVSPSATKP